MSPRRFSSPYSCQSSVAEVVSGEEVLGLLLLKAPTKQNRSRKKKVSRTPAQEVFPSVGRRERKGGLLRVTPRVEWGANRKPIRQRWSRDPELICLLALPFDGRTYKYFTQCALLVPFSEQPRESPRMTFLRARLTVRNAKVHSRLMMIQG